MDQWLDLIIPRGGASLIEAVVSMARMPVIKHYDGICHVYVDAAADPAMAEAIAVNSKVQKPSVCNAAETLLVHRAIAPTFVPRIAAALAAKGVEVRGDEAFRALAGDVQVVPATEADWTTEYLDYILSAKVVDDLDAAIAHINRYGSHHTDTIVTSDEAAAAKFQLEIDSACVFWNCSTASPTAVNSDSAPRSDQHRQAACAGADGTRGVVQYKYLVFGSGQLK